MFYAYTLGSLEVYDPDVTVGICFKGVGGSVWKDWDTVLRYFENISGTVTLASGRSVPAGIYLVELPCLFDDCVEDYEDSLGFGSLLLPCKVVKRLHA